jgi:hypothetical protein
MGMLYLNLYLWKPKRTNHIKSAVTNVLPRVRFYNSSVKQCSKIFCSWRYLKGRVNNKIYCNSAGCQIIAHYFKVFHLLHSVTFNTPSIFQPKAHLCIIHISSHLSFVFWHLIYSICRENLILFAQNHLLHKYCCIIVTLFVISYFKVYVFRFAVSAYLDEPYCCVGFE